MARLSRFFFPYVGVLLLLPSLATAAELKTGQQAGQAAEQMMEQIAGVFDAAHLWDYSHRIRWEWKGAKGETYPTPDPNRKESYRQVTSGRGDFAQLLVGGNSRHWYTTRRVKIGTNKAGQKVGTALIKSSLGPTISARVNFDNSEMSFKMEKPGHVASPAFTYTLSIKKAGKGWKAQERTKYNQGRPQKNNFRLNSRKGIVGNVSFHHL